MLFFRPIFDLPLARDVLSSVSLAPLALAADSDRDKERPCPSTDPDLERAPASFFPLPPLLNADDRSIATADLPAFFVPAAALDTEPLFGEPERRSFIDNGFLNFFGGRDINFDVVGRNSPKRLRQ